MSDKVNIYRGSEVVCVLPLSASVFNKRLMAEHSLEFNFTSPSLLDLQIGNTLTFDNEVMTINKQAEVVCNHEYRYTVKFQGYRHTLERFILKDEGSLSFSYLGDANDFLLMFLECVNSVDSGWTIGEVDHFEPVTLTFDKVNCLDALTMIAEGLGAEWQMIGKQISLVKHVGKATNLTFEYGQGKGLYSLTLLHENSSKIVTRAYAQGGTENLPAGYTKPNLQLDGFIEDAEALAMYGVREGVFEDVKIYPQRTSTATAVGQINEGTFTLRDATLDFDLEGQRISGQDAKIVFKSGALNGQEFKILSYKHNQKEIRYEANKDANGNLSPSGYSIAEIGDKYTLIGIRMPQSYIDAALLELTNKRLEYLNENKIPRVRYDLNIDVLNLRKLNVEPREGDLVKIIHRELGIDDEIRVTSISYPGHYKTMLESGMKFTAEVGNEVHYMRVERVEKDIKKTQEIVVSTNSDMIEYNRLQSYALSQFKNMVFDPDGNASQVLIDAMGAIFGADSQNFDLVDVFIRPNADNNANKITFTAGGLVHHKYAIELGNTWQMNAFAKSDLVSGSSYYISAKCSRNELTGIWVLSTTPISVDDEEGYWHFNLGVISSVVNNQRFTNITKGFSFITGGQILTERLIARHIQTATSGSRTTINVAPSDPSDPTGNLNYYEIEGTRRYHKSGRISAYNGIVTNLSITVNSVTRTINGDATVVFKDEIGSPILYVIDSVSANGLQYVSNSDSVQYFQITGHRFITNSLNQNASDSMLLDELFTYYGGSDEYIPNMSYWCGYYERVIYTLNLGMSASSGSVWKRVSASEGTSFVTHNNDTTPIAPGWYYRLGNNMYGEASYYDEFQIVFNLSLQLHYINSQGKIAATKNLNIQNIRWYQGGSGSNTCSSITPQIEINNN